MSLDINELVRLVKRAAVEAVQAGAPMSGGYGYVTSTSPLEITVDQKKILQLYYEYDDFYIQLMHQILCKNAYCSQILICYYLFCLRF